MNQIIVRWREGGGGISPDPWDGRENEDAPQRPSVLYVTSVTVAACRVFVALCDLHKAAFG